MPATLLEDDNLLALRLRNDFGRNGQAFAVLQFRALTGQQTIVQCNRRASFTSQLLNYDLVSCGNTILLAARAHNSEHGLSLHSSMLMRKTNRPAKCLRAGSRSAPGLRQVCHRDRKGVGEGKRV